MKTIHFLPFIFYTSFLFAQNNPPVAIIDSGTTYAGVLKNFTKFTLFQNDSDPDGNTLYLDTAFYFTGHGAIAFAGPSGNYFSIKYTPDSFYYGKDTVYYVVQDNGTPSMSDTGIIVITVLYKLYEDYAYLDINNISARINAGSSLFWNLYDGPAFEVPKGSGVNSIFNCELWMGGYDTLNNLHLSAAMYGGYNTDTVFRWGPLSSTGQYSFSIDSLWNRVWKIKKTEIDSFIIWKQTGFPSNYTISKNITDWPAHGDTNLGQSYYLAPFVDVDNDGSYKPVNGDFPDIKGDETALIIFNDARPFIIAQYKLKLEIIMMAYAFNCPSDSAIYNTLFLNYNIRNKSVFNYDSVFAGIYFDVDIGCVSDDFLGTDVGRGTIYGYNGDYVDGNPCSPASSDYGFFPPAQGLVCLRGPKLFSDAIDNPVGGCDESINGFGFGDTIIDNECLGFTNALYFDRVLPYPQDDPETGSDYYNYLHGRWKNNSKMVYGANGYYSCGPPFTCVPTDFVFPDDTDPCGWGQADGNGGIPLPQDPQNPWNEVSAGNTGGDRRAIGSSGPFRFSKSETVELDYALVFAQDSSGPLSSVKKMQRYIDSVRVYFNRQMTPCGDFEVVDVQEIRKPDLKIFPNPALNYLFVQNRGMEKNSVLYIFNSYGQQVMKVKATDQNIAIPVNDLPPGLYILLLKDEKNVLTGKFIKAG